MFPNLVHGVSRYMSIHPSIHRMGGPRLAESKRESLGVEPSKGGLRTKEYLSLGAAQVVWPGKIVTAIKDE